jgi:hypothetical protein
MEELQRCCSPMDSVQLISAQMGQPSLKASRSTSLVHVPRIALATVSRSESARPSSNDVWTVSVSDNGAFNFYAVPRSGSEKNASSQSDFPKRGSISDWAAPQSQDVVAQYAFYATLASPANGQYLNIYA